MPVGTTLQNLRRERGRSLAEMETSTRIMGRMLSALENERWDELPAPVYVRGYIQNYASVLGTDPQPLLKEYAEDIAGSRDRVEKPHLHRIPERTVVPHRLDVHSIPRGAWTALAIAVVVVILAVWGISALLGRDDTPRPIPPETTATATPSGSTSGTGTAGSAATEGSFTLEVEVAEGQSSWLQVRVDALIAYEGTLPGGEIKQWTVSDSAVIAVGKPAAVMITRDGVPVTIPPATGAEPVEVTLTADPQ